MDLEITVRTIAVERFNLKSLDDTDRLVEDLGVTSLQKLEFVMDIELRCNIEISDEAGDAVRVAREAPANQW